MSAAVLLPGLDGTGVLLERFAGALGAALDTCIVAYPPALSSSYAELEKLALAALPSDAPYLLIGESFSGPIAISLAAKAPPGLKGLVLCATFARSPIPILQTFAPLLRFARARLPMFLLRHLLLGRWATASIERALAGALTQIPAEVIRERVRAVLSVDVSAQLSAVRVPVMYLQATEDRMIPSAAGEYLRQVAPSVEIVRIEGPHFLLQAAPESCLEKILEFAKKVGLPFVR
jgi:pimeloyl-ACP methyl ester carboxylesterase